MLRYLACCLGFWTLSSFVLHSRVGPVILTSGCWMIVWMSCYFLVRNWPFFFHFFDFSFITCTMCKYHSVLSLKLFEFPFKPFAHHHHRILCLLQMLLFSPEEFFFFFFFKADLSFSSFWFWVFSVVLDFYFFIFFLQFISCFSDLCHCGVLRLSFISRLCVKSHFFL